MDCERPLGEGMICHVLTQNAYETILTQLGEQFHQWCPGCYVSMVRFLAGGSTEWYSHD